MFTDNQTGANDDSTLQNVDPAVQSMINEPPVDPNGYDKETEQFINDVMSRVISGEIDLYKSSTLIKNEQYELASELVQGKTDQVAINFCSKLREIRDLMRISGGDTMFVKPTYQLNLLVQELKYKKEEFEKQYGDLLKI